MDNIVIKKSFTFGVDIIKFCGYLESLGGIERTISWQLIRSGTSIGANAQEAQAAQSKADFIAKLYISRKEARETVYWLSLMISAGITGRNEIEELKNNAEDLLRIITAIINTTKKNLAADKKK